MDMASKLESFGTPQLGMLQREVETSGVVHDERAQALLIALLQVKTSMSALERPGELRLLPTLRCPTCTQCCSQDKDQAPGPLLSSLPHPLQGRDVCLLPGGGGRQCRPRQRAFALGGESTAGGPPRVGVLGTRGSPGGGFRRDPPPGLLTAGRRQPGRAHVWLPSRVHQLRHPGQRVEGSRLGGPSGPGGGRPRRCLLGAPEDHRVHGGGRGACARGAAGHDLQPRSHPRRHQPTIFRGWLG